MVLMVSLPSPTPMIGDVAVVEDAAEDALVDVDALDLVEAHLEGAPLDEAGLVDDAQIGDVGLGGPAMEPGLDASSTSADKRQRSPRRPDRPAREPCRHRARETHEQDASATIQAAIAGK